MLTSSEGVSVFVKAPLRRKVSRGSATHCPSKPVSVRLRPSRSECFAYASASKALVRRNVKGLDR